MKTQNELIKFMQDPQLRQSDLIYDGAILQLYVNELELEDGQRVKRELIHHHPAVAILGVQGDQVLLVRQYRAAVTKDVLEVPAGIIDLVDGALEAPEVAARRELEEETGYQASTWEYLGSYDVTPGYNNESIVLFKAEGLQEVDNPLPQDEDEDVTAHWYSRQEVEAMMGRHEIHDMKTALALQFWLNTEEGSHGSL